MHTGVGKHWCTLRYSVDLVEDYGTERILGVNPGCHPRHKTILLTLFQVLLLYLFIVSKPLCSLVLRLYINI